MRAVVARSHEGRDGVGVVDAPVPEAGPGQVRVRVHAAAVNPVDLATRDGLAGLLGLPDRSVHGLGWDLAGAVDQLGAGADGPAVGQPVVGLLDLVDVALGAQAQYVVLDADAVAPAPATVSTVEAATLPLNGLTAVQALDLLELREGQTILVTGAAGGVGGFAVQLAVRRGLRVVALAGDGDETLVGELGAEWFVPRTADLVPVVRALVPGGVDGVLDAAVLGGHALGAVRGGGSFAAVIPDAAPQPLRGIRVGRVFVRADGAALADLVTVVDAGRLTLRVAHTMPLDEVAAAHERLARGGLRGRVVLTPWR
ncbi:MAG: NADP-dependent oxidoreductase [Kutzneria sp.]|nr:NADP-dependent oxidoreductase [Kutzneria sp.]MBV9847170.1 NADP-dependent oxidoreductase [Kutzneria sp.]